MSQKATQKSVIIFLLFVKDAFCVLCLSTLDAQPISINTAHLVQIDQSTVLRFQDSFIFHSKYVRLNYKYFYHVLFAKK